MTLIIGVNHLGVYQGNYSLSFRYPSVSSDLLEVIDGKSVGLELLSPNDRKEINESFWKGNPDNIFSDYNPEAAKYFENIESLIEKPVYLDSLDLHKQLIELDEKYRQINRLISINFYSNDGDMSKDASSIIEAFKTRSEIITIDTLKRDEILLSNIKKYSPDVAIVGLGHASRWAKNLGLEFEFLGEDMLLEAPLSELNAIMSLHDMQYLDVVMDWRGQLFDSQRSKKPDYVGMYFPYTPNEYFEIFLDKNGDTGECFDAFGNASVKIDINSNNFSMNKKYLYHTSTKSNPEFMYLGELKNNIIRGRIADHVTGFVMFKSLGDTSENLMKLYNVPTIKKELQNFEPSNSIVYFPSGVGNSLERNSFSSSKSNTSDASELSGLLNTSDGPDDLPF